MQVEKARPQKESKAEFKYPKKPKRDPAKDSYYKKTTVLCNLKQINLEKENKKNQQYDINYEHIINNDNYTLKIKINKKLQYMI